MNKKPLSTILSTFSDSEITNLQNRIKDRKPNPTQRERDEEHRTLFYALNSWVALFSDMTGLEAVMLKSRIMVLGIEEAVNEAKTCAAEIRQAMEDPKRKPSKFQNDQAYYIGECRNKFWSSCLLMRPNIVNAMRVLEFPKRMKLSTLDVERSLWASFKDINRKMREIPYGTYEIQKGVNHHGCLSMSTMDELMFIFHILVTGYRRNYDLLTFPTGTTLEGHKTYLEKARQSLGSDREWCRNHGLAIPDYADWYFPVPVDPITGKPKYTKPANYSRFKGVPKDASKGRGIAMEPNSRMMIAYQVEWGLRHTLYMNRYSQIKDQTLNQAAAVVGSIVPGWFATADWTSASDSVAAGLIAKLTEFDKTLYEDLYLVRSSYIRHGGETIRSYMQSNMGNATTFDIEILVFATMTIWSILKNVRFNQSSRKLSFKKAFGPSMNIKGYWREDVKTTWISEQLKDVNSDPSIPKLWEKWAPVLLSGPTHIPSKKETRHWTLRDWVIWSFGLFFIYGDDVVCPPWAIETLKDLGEQLGFTMNASKSYYVGNYRESCGVEAFDGQGFHNDIYPRGTSTDELAQLIALQHTFAYDAPLARSFVERCILSKVPGMTSSELGADCNDLWDQYYSRKGVKSSVYIDRKDEKSFELTPLGEKFKRLMGSVKFQNSMSVSEFRNLKLLYEKQHRVFFKPTKRSHLLLIKKRLGQWVENIRDGAYTVYKSCRLGEISKENQPKSAEALEEYQKTVENGDYTQHFALVVKHTKKAQEYVNTHRDQVDYLKMLLYLGKGIDHINNNPYSEPQNHILDDRDLVEVGTPEWKKLHRFD